jgi:predicted peptidase
MDRFIQQEYQGQKYNLYIPEDYDPKKSYPLVQFIHDASVCGEDPKLTLAQGIGALVWARPEEQKKHPCFVFAPQFGGGNPIVNDDWQVDPRLELSKQALDHVIDTYSIDRDRIYTTGQSMGCMSSIVENVRYPEFFAASFLVAGQWDDKNIPGLEKQHLWMLCSQGDFKAFPIMNQMGVTMERAGAKIARRVMEAGLSQQAYHQIAAELEAQDANIFYTPYKLETVADGWHSNGGEHHMTTWQTAYEIEAIRDWMFRQHR